MCVAISSFYRVNEITEELSAPPDRKFNIPAIKQEIFARVVCPGNIP